MKKLKTQHLILMITSFVMVAALILGGVLLFTAGTKYELSRIEITIGNSAYSVTPEQFNALLNVAESPINATVASLAEQGIIVAANDLQAFLQANDVSVKLASVSHITTDDGELTIHFNGTRIENEKLVEKIIDELGSLQSNEVPPYRASSISDWIALYNSKNALTGSNTLTRSQLITKFDDAEYRTQLIEIIESYDPLAFDTLDSEEMVLTAMLDLYNEVAREDEEPFTRQDIINEYAIDQIRLTGKLYVVLEYSVLDGGILTFADDMDIDEVFESRPSEIQAITTDIIETFEWSHMGREISLTYSTIQNSDDPQPDEYTIKLVFRR